MSDAWLSYGLAFVGGYGNAASFVLADTFTGHITGALVLTSISMASHDWPTFLGRVLSIVLFLFGLLLSVMLGSAFAKKLSLFLLPVVMGMEIVLILTAYFALASPLGAGRE